MRELLRTARLAVRPLSPADADDVVEMLMKPELYTVIGGAPESREAAHQRVSRWAAGSPSSDSLWINFAVRLRDAGHVVGLCQATVSLNGAGDAEDCSIAYLVDPDHHRRGIGTEMMAAFVEHLAKELTPATFTAHIAPGHVPSERLAAKVGFTVGPTIDDAGERIWSLHRR